MEVKREIKKGYKQTDIGVIPEDWEMKRLSSLGSFYKGSGIAKSEANSGDIGAVRYGELYTDYHNYINRINTFVSCDVAKRAKRIMYGDVLFAGSGETKEEIGKCATLLYNKECYAGGDIIIFRPKECNSLFLGFVLNIPYVQSQKATKGQGDAIVHISSTSLQQLTIALPKDIKEQNAVASALSAIDSLIEALDKKIAKKRAIKEGAMQQLLTGKKRLSGFSGEWVEKKLGEIFDFYAGGDVDKNTYSLVKTTNHKYPIYANALVNEGMYGYSSNYTIDSEAITITGRGDVGKVFYREKCFTPIVRLITGISKKNIDVKFISYVCDQISFTNESTGVPQLTVPQVKEYSIFFPVAKSEQTAIAQILIDMDNEIEQLEKEQQKYIALKQGAMQKLLTGQIRLSSINQTQLSEKPQKQTNVHFKRSVWAAEIADRLCDEPTFGHVKMEKLIFLTEHLCGVDIGSNYHRDAAGPYDNRAIRSIDSQLKKQKWFVVARREMGYRYLPLSKRGGHKDYFNKYYSDAQTTFDKVINTFRSWNTERCEIVATLYSVWKDFENTKQQYTDNDIINEVLNNWHESKKRIPEERWQKALDWMRENEFAPNKN